MESRSATGRCSATGSICFDEDNHSPVKTASLIFNPQDSIILASAGILFPSCRRMMSPGTRCSCSNSCSVPSRMTSALYFTTFFNSDRAFVAFCSCRYPMKALISMAPRMTMLSVYFSSKRVTEPANNRMRTRGFLNCERKRKREETGFSSARVLLPYIFLLCSASC